MGAKQLGPGKSVLITHLTEACCTGQYVLITTDTLRLGPSILVSNTS